MIIHCTTAVNLLLPTPVHVLSTGVTTWHIRSSELFILYWKFSIFIILSLFLPLLPPPKQPLCSASVSLPFKIFSYYFYFNCMLLFMLQKLSMFFLPFAHHHQVRAFSNYLHVVVGSLNHAHTRFVQKVSSHVLWKTETFIEEDTRYKRHCT